MHVVLDPFDAAVVFAASSYRDRLSFFIGPSHVKMGRVFSKLILGRNDDSKLSKTHRKEATRRTVAFVDGRALGIWARRDETPKRSGFMLDLTALVATFPNESHNYQKFLQSLSWRLLSLSLSLSPASLPFLFPPHNSKPFNFYLLQAPPPLPPAPLPPHLHFSTRSRSIASALKSLFYLSKVDLYIIQGSTSASSYIAIFIFFLIF